MNRALLLFALAATAAAQVKLPPYTRQTLPNGAVIELMPRRDVPLTTVRVIVKGGAESDPAGMAGLSAMTAELLRRGTATRTAAQFSDELDFIGASWSAQADAQATIIQTEFLSKDVDRALALLSDAVLHPAFPDAEVTKALAERIESVKSVKDSAQAAINPYFRAFFFGPDHPYGRIADELTLKRITRPEIVSHHARSFVGSNMIVVAAGDFDSAALGAKLAAAFGPAQAGAPYRWYRPSPEKPNAPPAPVGLLLVDKPDATQTYFMIGNRGLDRTNPDRVAVWLVNTLFGGRFTSMLNDELRVNSGLTYGAASRYDQNKLPGAIAISTYTPTETTVKAIDLALDVLKRLREKGLTADQLASAKAYLKGTFPTSNLETASQLAGVLSEIELFGLNRGEMDDLFSSIDAVTLEQANAVARKYYGAGTLCFTLVGNAAKIREAAAKYAPKVVEVPITRPGFGAAE